MRKYKEYTVHSLAKLAGISVRTLQYYDSIGLLKPSKRTDADYRIYMDKDLLKLQQILFYRELDFPLEDIKNMVNSKKFNTVRALENHRKMLLDKSARTESLVANIDRTIKHLKEKTMLKDEELYEGFTKEEIKQFKDYEKEAQQRWDPEMVKESQKRVRSMSKEQWQKVKQEGEDNTKFLASLINKDPASKEVQDAITKHYAHLNNFYTPNLQMYKGLGELYVTDDRFRAHYDRYVKGLADFIKKAIDVFVEKSS